MTQRWSESSHVDAPVIACCANSQGTTFHLHKADHSSGSSGTINPGLNQPGVKCNRYSRCNPCHVSCFPERFLDCQTRCVNIRIVWKRLPVPIRIGILASHTARTTAGSGYAKITASNPVKSGGETGVPNQYLIYSICYFCNRSSIGPHQQCQLDF